MSVLQAVPSPPKVFVLHVVVGLVLSNNPACCGGGSVATGRASHDGQAKGDDPDEKGYPGPPVWGLELEINNLTSVKKKKTRC